MKNLRIRIQLDIIILFTWALLLISCNTTPPETTTGDNLAGLYKLYIMENMDSTGKWIEDSWAKGGDGYLLYDGLGHMAGQIIPKGYKDFKWLEEGDAIDETFVKAKIDSMSTQSLKAALTEFSSNYVYFANYSIDKASNVVTHDRIASSIPSIWGTKVKREFLFRGDTLILKILEGNRRLKWIKQMNHRPIKE